jgi:hypothetical protein
MVSNPFGKPGDEKLEKLLKVKGSLSTGLAAVLDESTGD